MLIWDVHRFHEGMYFAKLFQMAEILMLFFFQKGVDKFEDRSA